MSGPTGADRADAAVEQLRLTRVDAYEKLVDALARAGFKRCDDALPNCEGPGWRGTLTFTANGDTKARQRATVVDVVVPEEYPFASPRVHPGNRGWAEVATGKPLSEEYYEPGRGWHRENDLAMCLFDDADHTRLPWASGAALLQQATSWLAADAVGWPDDVPALDLERYLDTAREKRVLLYGALDGLDGVVRRARAQRNGVLRLAGPAGRQRSGRRSGTRRWGPDAVWIAAAGELTGPIRSWQDLCTTVGPDRAEALTRAYRVGLQRVLLSYTRQEVPAALALELIPGPDRTIELRALPSAPDDNATRAIRAGREAADLASRRVAVIGVGAVGSVVADLLHRSGVGQVHLIDADRLLPGNTTRHLLGEAAVGLPKSSAIADKLRAARPMHGKVTAQVGALRTAKDAAELLAAFDVVVDATADSTATAMLTAAAGAGAGQLLSVAVLADGYAVRVDRTPLPERHKPLPEPQLPSPGPTVYEAGCGSPVSTTPPWAVWEAAAIAARHTVGLLTDPGSIPAGEERRLTFLGDAQ